jgi:predicted RNA binding protein YcfA (HicA-like mRNA interferase family)
MKPFGGGKKPPLTCKQVKHGLKSLGFAFREQKGSHEQWVREGPPFRKVTVDCPKSPFSPILIGFMAEQAGVSKTEFYKACLAG